MKAATLLAGVLVVLVPVVTGPSWAQPAAAIGLLGVLVSAWRRLGWAGLVAVIAAIVQCAISRPGAPVLAAEGLLILGYLLLLDIPPEIPRQARPRWLRQQFPMALAALVTAGAVLAGLALAVASAWWYALAGIGAAVVAVVIALPHGNPGPDSSQRPPG